MGDSTQPVVVRGIKCIAQLEYYPAILTSTGTLQRCGVEYTRVSMGVSCSGAFCHQDCHQNPKARELRSLRSDPLWVSKISCENAACPVTAAVVHSEPIRASSYDSLASAAVALPLKISRLPPWQGESHGETRCSGRRGHSLNEPGRNRGRGHVGH